jgi:hypothetical protein
MTAQWPPPPAQPQDLPTQGIPQQRLPMPGYPMAPPPGSQAPVRARRWPVVVATIVGLVVGAGVTAAVLAPATSSSPGQPTALGGIIKPSTFALNGVLQLTDSRVVVSNGTCSGTGGYADITTGASITVSDASHTTVATGELGVGQGGAGSCTFTFTISDVPDSSAFYSVEVTHRGQVTFSRDVLRTQGAQLSLGS